MKPLIKPSPDRSSCKTSSYREENKKKRSGLQALVWDLGPICVRLAINGTNPGIISYQLLTEPKCTNSLIWKKIPFGVNLKQFGPVLISLVSSFINNVQWPRQLTDVTLSVNHLLCKHIISPFIKRMFIF